MAQVMKAKREENIPVLSGRLVQKRNVSHFPVSGNREKVDIKVL